MKYAHEDILKSIAAGKITIGGSPNRWTNDNCFEEINITMMLNKKQYYSLMDMA